MPHSSLPLQGYTTPFVKNGEVVLPVRARGEMCDLVMSPALARGVAFELRTVMGPKRGRPANLTEKATAGQPLTKPGGGL